MTVQRHEHCSLNSQCHTNELMIVDMKVNFHTWSADTFMSSWTISWPLIYTQEPGARWLGSSFKWHSKKRSKMRRPVKFFPRGPHMENPDLEPHLWASCFFSSDNTQFDQKFQSNDDQDLSEQLPPKVSWQVFSEACMPNRGKIATYCTQDSGTLRQQLLM